MIRFDAWWFPDGETQLPDEMSKVNLRVDGRLTWQYHKYVAALSLLPLDRRRVAVDVGAHVGLWSYYMARDFAELHAFEPNIEAAWCWGRNLPAGTVNGCDARLHQCALGADHGIVTLEQAPGQSGGAHIWPIASAGAEGTIEQRPLDDFELDAVDLIKIDVEGYETAVIEGARKTLLRCKPIVIVEEALWSRYGYDSAPATDLVRLGMQQRTALGPDKIYEWT